MVFGGGYIGVDIFFVISGYLITSILSQQMHEQRFSVAEFYKKRVVRLAPTFFTVLIAVSVIAWQVMLPDELIKYAQSAIYGTFLMGNVYMRDEVGDYFSQSVDSIPLLHLWSLGVEEQFYIFWPLILLVMFKVKRRQWLVVVVVAGIIASLYYAKQQLGINSQKAYYSMPVRAFELLLGALIVFLPKMVIPRIWVYLGVTLALAVLAATTFYFDQHTPFPGTMALIPCLATVAIIYLGSTGVYHPLLSHGLSVWIGKISYPLYLWHWPIIVFAGFYLLPQTLAVQLGLLVFVLAWLTYRYIEQPCKRFSKSTNWRVIGLGFMLPAFSLATAAKIVEQKSGFPERFSIETHRALQALNSFSSQIRKSCHGTNTPMILPNPNDCLLGIKKQKIDFLLIGDSHANSYAAMLDIWAKDAYLRGYDITQTGTLYLPNVHKYHSKRGKIVEFPIFKQRNDTLSEHLKHNQYSMIILSGYYNAYLQSTTNLRLDSEKTESSKQNFILGLRTAISYLKQASPKVIILLDVPELKTTTAECSTRVLVLQKKDQCYEEYKRVEKDAMEFLHILKDIQHDFPDLLVVDPTKIFCDEYKCNTVLNGVPLYRNKDNNHLNYKGSQEIGRVYLEKLGNPLQ